MPMRMAAAAVPAGHRGVARGTLAAVVLVAGWPEDLPHRILSTGKKLAARAGALAPGGIPDSSCRGGPLRSPAQTAPPSPPRSRQPPQTARLSPWPEGASPNSRRVPSEISLNGYYVRDKGARTSMPRCGRRGCPRLSPSLSPPSLFLAVPHQSRSTRPRGCSRRSFSPCTSASARRAPRRMRSASAGARPFAPCGVRSARPPGPAARPAWSPPPPCSSSPPPPPPRGLQGQQAQGDLQYPATWRPRRRGASSSARRYAATARSRGGRRWSSGTRSRNTGSRSRCRCLYEGALPHLRAAARERRTQVRPRRVAGLQPQQRRPQVVAQLRRVVAPAQRGGVRLRRLANPPRRERRFPGLHPASRVTGGGFWRAARRRPRDGSEEVLGRSPCPLWGGIWAEKESVPNHAGSSRARRRSSAASTVSAASSSSAAPRNHA